MGADTSVHRHLWNPSYNYCYTNQYIDKLGHIFKKANALILRYRWFFVPLLRKDNFSECFNTYGMSLMTKIVLKLNCGDSKPLVLAENLPFLENIFGPPFSLNILLGWVVRKPVNVNSGLNVYCSIIFSWLKMFFTSNVRCSLRLIQLNTTGQTM